MAKIKVQVMRKCAANSRVRMPDSQERIVSTSSLEFIPGTRDAFYIESSMHQMPLKKKYKLVEDLLDVVVKGEAPSLLVIGAGGFGKSYAVTHYLTDKIGLEPVTEDTAVVPKNPSFVLVKGKVTPYGLYTSLYNNRNGITLIDDSDDLWSDKKSVAMLKAALDSSEHRIVSWIGQRTPMMANTPESFEYTGRCIIISNMSRSSFDQAVLTRCLVAELELTREQVFEKMLEIIPAIKTTLTHGEVLSTYQFIRKNADKFVNLSLRLLLNGCKIRSVHKSGWEQILLTQIS